MFRPSQGLNFGRRDLENGWTVLCVNVMLARYGQYFGLDPGADVLKSNNGFSDSCTGKTIWLD